VGDILSVNLEDAIVRDVGLEIRRTLTVREREVELALAKERAKIRLAEEESKKAGSGERKPAVEEKKGPYSASTPEEKDIPVSLADVDMSKTLELKAGETMMAEIVERYSNGNYRIRGTKRVPYRYGPPRLVTIMAVAKGGDISEEDVITSGKLYEYRVEAVR
jgi:hypothetical protein